MSARSSLATRASVAIAGLARPQIMGRVFKITGLLVQAHVPGSRIGDVVSIEREDDPVLGQVVGFKDRAALVVPFSELRDVKNGARVRWLGQGSRLPVSERLVGRVIDAFGDPIDGGPAIAPERRVDVSADSPANELREPVRKPLPTGVRVIDGLLTCGEGQRIGIFAGAGVGKTVLMRQIAEQSEADVAVIGLIGERGCEVQDLLATYPLERSVLVVATSDKSPLERARGAQTAMAVAESFRDKGKKVLLIIDSLTRYAMALREIGLSAGEPPATKGYPPSVFAALPRLLERACPMKAGGSITGFFTVLVEGDDMADPIADSARSLLDGHIVLSRELAGRGHFPAVDVLASASRVARQVSDKETTARAMSMRKLLSMRREAEELRSLGAYVPGHNIDYDTALTVAGQMDHWLTQQSDYNSPFAETNEGLQAVVHAADVTMNRLSKARSKGASAEKEGR